MRKGCDGKDGEIWEDDDESVESNEKQDIENEFKMIVIRSKGQDHVMADPEEGIMENDTRRFEETDGKFHARNAAPSTRDENDEDLESFEELGVDFEKSDSALGQVNRPKRNMSLTMGIKKSEEEDEKRDKSSIPKIATRSKQDGQLVCLRPTNMRYMMWLTRARESVTGEKARLI